MEGSPLAAGLVAFGVGFLAGSLLPPSRSEEHLLERVEPQLEEAAGTVAGAAKEAAGEVASVAKDEAAHVKEDVARAAQEATTQATQQVRTASS